MDISKEKIRDTIIQLLFYLPKIGKGKIIKILKGSKAKGCYYKDLSLWGVFKGIDDDTIREHINYLIEKDIIMLSNTDMPCYQVSHAYIDALLGYEH